MAITAAPTLDPFAPFLLLAAAHPDALTEDVPVLARSLLARPERDGAGRSTLNNDGIPLQWCISLGGSTRASRLIADPAASIALADERLARGRAALAALLHSRAPSLAALCEQTLAATVPPPAELATLASGSMWLASGIGTPGVALYTSANWGSDDARWNRAAQWLEAVLPDASAARRWVAALRPLARPVAHALEGESASRVRAKLYFRPLAPLPLISMGLDLLADTRLAGLLERLLGGFDIHPGTLVYSLGFAVSTGQLSDQKLDICAHCCPRPPQAWIELLDWWAARQGGPGFAANDALRSPAAEVAFVGAGVRPGGSLRTNLYLKPVPAT